MDTNQNISLSSEEVIRQLQQQLAEKDAQLTDAFSQLDDLHALVDEHSLIVTDNDKIADAIQEAETLRDELISWLASGEELSTAERRRLQGSGVRRLGFIVKVHEMMTVNPELTPDFLDRERFGGTATMLLQVRNLTTILQQAARLSNDVLLVLGNEAYRMALIYYGAVREAANRRVPGARELFRILQAFFRRGHRADEEPTEHEVERDLRALLHGKKDGKIVVENERPHLEGGKHVVVDETHKARAAWKESEKGRIDE